MAEERAERRVSAIFAADMVGYSRLMEADETGTLAALKAHRAQLIDIEIAAHNGRIVKTTGDGLLAEFASVVDAVAGATAIQRAMVERNQGVPRDRRVEFRIGVNLGDIIIDGDDIYGDGVNIAARLETLAEPGGICISGTAYDQLKTQVDVGYADLGEQKVRNIENPVRAYRVLLDADAAGTFITAQQPRFQRWRTSVVSAFVAAVIAAGGLAWWQPWAERNAAAPVDQAALPLSDKPSIAVLPFDNMSGDPEQTYFADGITEDIITDLSKISGLTVIARTSTNRYKGKSEDVGQIARDLGVRHLVEGSVRMASDRIRINVQLIDAIAGIHVWGERYDRGLEDIFAIQDDVTGQIVANLEIQLTPEEQRRFVREYVPIHEAHDRFLKGWATLTPPSSENLESARKLFEEAIEIDPRYEAGYSGLANVHALLVITRKSQSRKSDIEAALQLAEKAISLNDNVSRPYEAIIRVMGADGHLDDAIQTAKIAIERQPGQASILAQLGQALAYAGRAKEGIEPVERALRLDPFSPVNHARAAVTYLAAGDYDRSIATFERAKDIWGRLSLGRSSALAAAYMLAGRVEDANNMVRNILKRNSNYSVAKAKRAFQKREDIDRIYGAMRKAGLPEG